MTDHHDAHPPDARLITSVFSLRDLEDHIDQRITLRLAEHAAAEKLGQDELLCEVRKVQALLASAFPDGDADGHRRAHEEAIDIARDVRDLMREVRNKTVVGVVWAVVGLVAISVWQYIKTKAGAA